MKETPPYANLVPLPSGYTATNSSAIESIDLGDGRTQLVAPAAYFNDLGDGRTGINAPDFYEEILEGFRGVEGEVASLGVDIDTVENTVSLFGTRITTAEGDITLQDGRISVNENAITAAVTRITDAEGDVTSLQGSVTVLEDQVAINVTNVSTLQGETTTLSGRIDVTESNIAAQVSDISDIDGGLTTLQGTVTVNANAIAANVTSISTVDGKTDTNAGNISVNATDISSVVSRTTTVEGDVTTMQSSISQNATDIGLALTTGGEVITALNLLSGGITYSADLFSSDDYDYDSQVGFGIHGTNHPTHPGLVDIDNARIKGDLEAGGGNVVLDDDGIALTAYSFAVTAGNPVNIPTTSRIKWGTVAISGGQDDAFLDELTIVADTIAASGATLQVNAVQALGISVFDNLDFSGLPTSDPSISGRAWNNSGVLNISA